ncbi:hypothetical protein V498_09826, partial [Pseudogymnoascus sp. VKM F-4517 (FW-2822)]
MDEASTLIASLHSKLRELDHKVLLYRRDMAAEFTKHSDALLRDVAPDVAATVTAAVAEGMGAYPSLVDTVAATAATTSEEAEASPSTNPAGEIAREVGRLKDQGKLAPPPPIDVDGAADTDVPRSPHAREAEFLGVFTQGYLPLLDSSDKHERRSSGDGPAAEADRKAEAAAANLSASYSPPPRKPEPRRRNTDDSGAISDPENPVRRSALRRSTSSGKVNGLRRVRFEFAGKEFPTTSSPSVAETTMLPTALDDAMSSEAYSQGGGEQAEIEQVEDVDEEPAPRRISSSQALRMLSRGPIEDDGTKWDEVRAPADGSASVSIDDAGAALSDDEDFISIAPRLTSPQSPNGASPIAIPSAVSPSTSPHVSELHEDVSKVSISEAEEEEDILSEMTPLAPMHSTRGVVTNNTASPAIPIDISGSSNPSNTLTSSSTPPKAPAPTTAQPTRQSAATPATTAAPEATPATSFPTSTPHPDSDSEDDFFAFDDDAPSTRTRRRQPPRSQSPDSTSSSSSTPASPERPVPVALPGYATSPAQAIISPKARTTSADEAGDGDGDHGAARGEGANIPYTPTVGSSLRNSYHPFAEPI